jgi:hypothetical protein
MAPIFNNRCRIVPAVAWASSVPFGALQGQAAQSLEEQESESAKPQP